MAKYQKYAEYKDSGVEWLGEIPSHWEMWKLAHAYSEIGSGTTPSTTNEENFEGDIPWVTTGELRENTIFDTKKKVSKKTLELYPTLKKYPVGSVAIAMYGATIGRLGIFGVEATTNQACCVMTISKVLNNDYLFYWLQAFKDEIVQLSSGGGQPNINQEKVASLRISAPNVKDQTQIANFLDHETAKIDHLIEKQQQLIELLKEKRQAVISHAVTKGLDPNVPMKDSGVEWLGKVPEHWDTASLKYLCELLKDGTHLPPARVDSGVPLLSVRNIINNKFTFRDDDSQISESSYADLCKSFIPQNGDVLLAIVGATLGKVAVIEQMENFHIQRSLGIFRTKKTKLNNYFLAYLFSSKGFQSLLWENVGFSAQPGIYLGALSNFLIPVPSIEEQKNIIDFIKKQLDKFDNLINKALHSVQLMQERRTALISAAVTGKIDVRNWQAPTLAGAQTELSA